MKHTKFQASRSLNQLISLIVGASTARATAQYENNIKKRIKECHALVLSEMDDAFARGDTYKTEGCKRKINSMESLMILCEIVECADYQAQD